MSSLEVIMIPIFNDNYVFVIRHTDLKTCVVVDPGDAKPVQDYLSKHKLTLEAILLTHHHDDHIGGALELKEHWNVPVYAPLKNKTQISFATNYLVDKDSLSLLRNNLNLKVSELPGHTLGHIAYFEPNEKRLFSGDVLFGLGCGRVFEGTFAQAFESLQTIKSLPDETLVYCTHEYTETNLRFCKKLESTDQLSNYENSLMKKRNAHLPSVPLSLEVEKNVNPFLVAQDLERFTFLRELRNRS